MLVIELLSTLLGMLGAALLATRSRWAGWAFVAWLFSNLGWLVFGAGNQHWGFFLQQGVFLVTSLLGIWEWLIKPRLRNRVQTGAVPPGPAMTLERAKAILRLIDFPGYHFQVMGNSSPMYLQATFHAPCSVAGGQPIRQTTRKWQLSAHMTPSELVQTALKCALTSVEHEAREQFRYRGLAIFGPHFNVDRLAELCMCPDGQEVRS